MIWTAAALKKVTGGTIVGAADWAVSGVQIDSRKIKKGDLFIALAGDHHDGHDFAEAAAEAGAAAMLGSRRCETPLPQIIVSDCLEAMQQLAETARTRSDARRVAITGSVGKTGTKELIAAVLSAYGPCHATEGNFNNHIGAPLSLARMPQESRFGVFELGMNHAGEIAALSPLVAPDIAIITRIAASHIGHFDSLDAIAEAKAEIFDGLVPGGVAMINADDDYAAMLTAKARAAGAATVFSVGFAETASHRIIALDRVENGLRITADCNGERMIFSLARMAPHWAWAALFSLAIIQHEGLDPAPGLAALAAVEDMAGRGQQHQAKTAAGDRFTLIDDSYNASPASMVAAITALAGDPRPGRRVAILADMLELGDQAETLHRGLAETIRKAGLDLLILFGPEMKALHETLAGAMPGLVHVADAEAAITTAHDLIAADDLVLVKGSNGMKTGRVVQALLAKTPVPDGESHAA
ncbi:MAG: UDP-N-acetylmuramoyl-tripeptide--D-alanyl-D-alanine ligase [Candidatus Puniceispirillales bacterium]